MLQLRLEKTRSLDVQIDVDFNREDSYEFLDFGQACRINCYQ